MTAADLIREAIGEQESLATTASNNCDLMDHHDALKALDLLESLLADVESLPPTIPVARVEAAIEGLKPKACFEGPGYAIRKLRALLTGDDS